jgi:Sulfotransferase family
MAEQNSTPPVPFDFAARHQDIARLLAKDLVFIGAYPKSGTTWLQVMMNAHPEISCRGEGHFINRLGPLLEKALEAHNKLIAYKNTVLADGLPPFPVFEREDVLYLMTSAIALLLNRYDDGSRVIGEKTPDNAEYFPLLATLFPRAKFVHMVRDGRDCGVSAWFHNQRTHPDRMSRKGITLDGLMTFTAQHWASSVAAGVQFTAAHPDRCMTIRYEDVVAQPTAVMERVLDFLGVASTADAVRRCVDAGSFETMSGGRQPGTEDRSSFVRQGVPGDWRVHLAPSVNDAFVSHAGAQLKQFGYDG